MASKNSKSYKITDKNKLKEQFKHSVSHTLEHIRGVIFEYADEDEDKFFDLIASALQEKAHPNISIEQKERNSMEYMYQITEMLFSLEAIKMSLDGVVKEMPDKEIES